MVFWSTTTSNSSTSTGTAWWGGSVRVVIQQTPVLPQRCADQLYIEGALGRQFPVMRSDLCARECAGVRAALEVFGWGPRTPLDPAVARRDYRAMAKASHPDVGGDVERFKQISSAWDLLRRRGFVA